MSPLKSSLARTVGKLLGVSKDTDLSIRGDVQTARQSSIWSATGGTTITSGDYTYHVFTADTPSPQSSLVINAVAASRSAQILVVGGGGEGGKDDGGGGGAGSVVYDPTFTLSGSNTYAATVGATASTPSPPTSGGPLGALGNNSSFGSNFLAKGGGSGAKSPIPVSQRGGSGGGGAYPGVEGSPGSAPGNIPPSATSYQTANGSPGAVEGGGGGGAGSAGGNGSPGPGLGGNGRAFPEFPAPIIAPAIPSPQQSAFTSAVGPTGLFGGGGGAGGRSPAKQGGPGGGGPGGNPGSNPAAGTPGVYGTGGGGGGTGQGSALAGGDGAAGIIIVRYLTAG